MSDLPTLATRVVAVTLFEDRAEVRRAAELDVAAPGPLGFVLAGVGPYVDDASLEVKVPADAGLVTAARVRRRVHHAQRLGAEAIAALEAEVRAAERRRAEAHAAGERAEAALRQAGRLLEEWKKGLARVPRLAGEPERLAEWRAAWERASEALAAAKAAGHAAACALEDADRDLARAHARLAEGQELAPHHDTVVEVQLDARAAGRVAVELVYRTPCALWRPEHLARLVSAGAGERPTLELVTYATAWQATGERWEEVAVRFSTARTARAAEPPRLADDVLGLRKKSDDEKKKVVVEAREQAVAVAGLDRGARVVDEMPGVDDGGEPRAYAASAPVTLVSDGRPFRVEVDRVTLPAETALVLLPERALAAHLRATATLGRAEPLLAGPVTVARDAGVVGRAKLDFVAGGEPFELGFGVADEVRVRRRVDEKRDTAALTGKQIVERTVHLFLSNLSSVARRVEIRERVPVSEIEDVAIELKDAAWRFDGKDGFARREVELAAGAHQELTLAYEIRAASRVVLPF